MPVLTETPALTAKLVFHLYGDQYFLYQIWTPQNERGGQLSRSRSELELVRSAAEFQVVSITLLSARAEPEKVGKSQTLARKPRKD